MLKIGIIMNIIQKNMAEHLPGLLSLFNQVSNKISNQDSWEKLFEEMIELLDYYSEDQKCKSKDYES